MELLYILAGMALILLVAVLVDRRSGPVCPCCHGSAHSTLRGWACPGCGARSEQKRRIE